METLSIPPSPHKFLDFDDYAFASESIHHDFGIKLKIDQEDEKLEEQKEEQEFSFAYENPQGLLVAADEIFHNGKIRPLFPVTTDMLQLQPPLKKLFVERQHDSFCYDSKWQGAPKGQFQGLPLKTTALGLVVVEDSKEMCKKSNSTGFSKLLRYREDIKLRSYSNGKDAFVFLNPMAQVKKSHEAKVRNDAINNGKRKMAPSSSAYEKLYRKRKESDKRRSFLPYKQQLFGFFAYMNGFSRNIHPF